MDIKPVRSIFKIFIIIKRVYGSENSKLNCVKQHEKNVNLELILLIFILMNLHDFCSFSRNIQERGRELVRQHFHEMFLNTSAEGAQVNINGKFSIKK